jgi:hypothetical protein
MKKVRFLLIFESKLLNELHVSKTVRLHIEIYYAECTELFYDRRDKDTKNEVG